MIFDLTARRVEDIRYWCEVTVLSKEEFDARITEGFYTLPEGKSVPDGDAYPTWLQDVDGIGGDMAAATTSSSGGYRKLKNWQPWITVYEWYEDGRVQHWHDGFDQPLYDAPTDYIPYTLYFLNSNAQDCRGLSEILLVKPNIDAVNRLLTYIMYLVRMQIPRILFDSGVVSEEEIAKINSSEPASWVGLALKNAALIAQVFALSPIPNVPPEVQILLTKEESIISYVSALAESARGQVTGARTATELALIEGQLRTRLQARQSNVDDATSDVARKMLYLAAKKLTTPITVRTGTDPQGNPTWGQVEPTTLSDVDVLIECVPYTPLDNNRAVVEERFLTQLPIVAARPGVDQNLLNEEIARTLRLNPKLFQAPQPPAAPPGGPAGPENPLAGSGQLLPPELAAHATPKELAELAALSRGGPSTPSALPPQMANISDSTTDAAAGPDTGAPPPAPGT